MSALSAADKQRLDQDFQAIRDVETTRMGMGVQCAPDKLDSQAIQALNSGQAFKANGTIEDVAKLQMELVTLAFACNKTRVATLQCGTDGTRYVIDGQTLERFHWISHRIQSDGSEGAAIAGAAEMHRRIDRLRMNTFKYVLDKWARARVDQLPRSGEVDGFPSGDSERARFFSADAPPRRKPAWPATYSVTQAPASLDAGVQARLRSDAPARRELEHALSAALRRGARLETSADARRSP